MKNLLKAIKFAAQKHSTQRRKDAVQTPLPATNQQIILPPLGIKCNLLNSMLDTLTVIID